MLSRFLLAAAVAATLACVPAASAKTTWLCRPDRASDPCHKSLAATLVSPQGEVGAREPTPAAKPKVDCFYVYPTVSEEPKPQADFKLTPSVKAIGYFQAARFRSVCRIWAPVYRQVTLQGLLNPGTVTAAMRAQGYNDVLAAWRDYLAHDNHGRRVVLVSHSQGTFVLRDLIAKEIDRKPAQRKLLVSALLLGGNVLAGEFKHVPPCRKATQTGCVVAYSTYDETPPPNSVFGRAGKGQVLCTNPAALGGGSGKLDGYIPTVPFPGVLGIEATMEVGPLPSVPTPWISVPGGYTARCSAAGGAHVLRITPVPGGRDLTPEPDPTWGLHLSDVNIAQGTLVDLVRKELQ